jgi:hypothetical protein
VTRIPQEILTQHVAVLGKTGSGKTSTAKLAIEQVVADGARVCVLDPIKSDWWGMTSSADGKKPGLPFHILGGPRGHVPLHASAGKAIAEIVASGALPLSIIDMADFEPGGQAKFFTDFAPALLRKMRGVVYLVIEEAHLFAPKERSGIGAENLSIHWAKTLATAGRSKGIRLIPVTQRVQALHNAVLGSCDTLIAHRLTAPADQEPVIKWLKANTSKEILERVSSSLSSLKTGEGWICSGEAKIFELAHFRRIRTYDNTATPTGDGELLDVKTAPVDQDKLRAIIGDAVKDAQANDPRELKKEIAKLRGELEKASREKSVTPTKTVEKAILTDADRALLEKVATRLQDVGTKAIDRQRQRLDVVKAEIAATLDSAWRTLADYAVVERDEIAAVLDAKGFNKILDKLATVKTDANYSKNITGLAGRRADRPVRTVAAVVPRRQGVPAASGTLPPARQKILNALAWFDSIGVPVVDKTQLALMVGVSPTSGGYFNNLGALRSDGFIEYPNGGSVALTEAGQAIAVVDNVPSSSEELHTEIARKLPPAKWKILEQLIAIYPQSISKDGLAEHINVSPTSGGYFNNLGSLRSLGLIDYPRPSEVVALPVLFLENR